VVHSIRGIIMITLMIGKSPANAAPVRGLYMDGKLVATFCALTKARDLRTQLMQRCGIKKDLEDADERLEGAYTKVFCDIDKVTKFPQFLEGSEPTEVLPVEEPLAEVRVEEVLGAVITEPVVEGAGVGALCMTTYASAGPDVLALTPAQKAKITRAKNKALKAEKEAEAA